MTHYFPHIETQSSICSDRIMGNGKDKDAWKKKKNLISLDFDNSHQTLKQPLPYRETDWPSLQDPHRMLKLSRMLFFSFFFLKKNLFILYLGCSFSPHPPLQVLSPIPLLPTQSPLLLSPSTKRHVSHKY